MSDENVAHGPHRAMTAEEWIELRPSDAPLAPWKLEAIRSVRWTDIKPCASAWSMVEVALNAAEVGAKARWRERNAVRVERAVGCDCAIYRVARWDERVSEPAAGAGPVVALVPGVATSDRRRASGAPGTSGFLIDDMYEEPFPSDTDTDAARFGAREDLLLCRGYDVVAAMIAREVIDHGTGAGANHWRVLAVLERIAKDVVGAHASRAERTRATRLLKDVELPRKGAVPPLDELSTMSDIEQQLRERASAGAERSAIEALVATMLIFALDLGGVPSGTR